MEESDEIAGGGAEVEAKLMLDNSDPHLWFNKVEGQFHANSKFRANSKKVSSMQTVQSWVDWESWVQLYVLSPVFLRRMARVADP